MWFSSNTRATIEVAPNEEKSASTSALGPPRYMLVPSTWFGSPAYGPVTVLTRPVMSVFGYGSKFRARESAKPTSTWKPSVPLGPILETTIETGSVVPPWKKNRLAKPRGLVTTPL